MCMSRPHPQPHAPVSDLGVLDTLVTLRCNPCLCSEHLYPLLPWSRYCMSSRDHCLVIAVSLLPGLSPPPPQVARGILLKGQCDPCSSEHPAGTSPMIWSPQLGKGTLGDLTYFCKKGLSFLILGWGTPFLRLAKCNLATCVWGGSTKSHLFQPLF